MIKLSLLYHGMQTAITMQPMCLNWRDKYVYNFPPFSMLFRVLQNLQEDQVKRLVIAPLWRTQVRMPKMCQLLNSQQVSLPKDASLLQLPQDRTKLHLLWLKLQLMACLSSGQDSDNKTFQMELATSSWNHGRLAPPNSTECI